MNIQSVGLAKAFSPTPINAGETSTLTITLQNPTSSDYTGVALTDVLPATPNTNLQIVGGTAQTTCTTGGSPATLTVTPPRTIVLTGGTIPSGTIVTPGTCTITVNVTTPDSSTSAIYTNTIALGAMTANGGISNILSASANLEVRALSVGTAKGFSPNRFQEGGTTTVTITLSNPTSSAFTGVTFTDLFPPNIIPQSASTTCGAGVATYNNTTLPHSVSLTGGTVPARVGLTPGTCTITATATGSVVGTYTNTIPANIVTTDQGITNLTSSSGAVTVYATDQGITATKAFSPTSISAGSNSRLRITINAPADEALTGFSITDNLPLNLTISNSNAPTFSAGCGSATLTAATGANTITLSSPTIAAGASCQINVYVTSPLSGVYSNVIPTTAFINNESQKPPSNVSAPLSVSHLTISKAFYPNTVSPNGLSRATVTLTNTNTSPLVNVSFADNLNTMGGTDVTIAPTPNAITNCGPGVFTFPGPQIISMTGGTVPAQVGAIPGICTISFDVRAPGPATTRTNSVVRTDVNATVFGTSTVIQPVLDATANLTITPLSLSIVKSFNPITVFGGSASKLEVSILNPNNTVLTGIQFTDTMPAGMFITNPPNLSTGSCGGTLTGTPGTQIFSFSDGILTASKRCTLSLDVTMNVNGNRTNTIPAGGVTTFNGATNAQLAQASLTNLPGASISKYFSPNPIVLGNSSLLTITILNTGNVPLTNMGLIDTLPTGLTVSNASTPTNDCNGTFRANPDDTDVQLSGGSLVAGPGTTCSMVFSVTSTTAGNYLNVIAKNSLSSNEGATNSEPAEDTLVITAAPELQLTKTVTNAGPFILNGTINYELVATNNGDIPLTGVSIADPGTGVTLGTCSPTAPAVLAPGASMTCGATHIVTSDDVTNGTYSNTAFADSDQTGPTSDTADVPIGASHAMTISKVSTSPSPHFLGQTLTYNIIVRNIGSDQLTGVTVTDPGVGVTLGSCTPTNGSPLDAGQTMLCAASHVVTQPNVDAGTFSNTAYADSNETLPVNDTVVVPITQAPSLRVYKQVTSTGPYTVGSTITYDISVVNTGNQTLHNVYVTDPGTGVILGTCSPAQYSTLASGEILSCAASHVVTTDDIAAGGFSNTAYGDSDETDVASDTATVITTTPSIQLEKTGTITQNIVPPNNVTNVGDRINYTFTITNNGSVALSNVTLSEIVGGITIVGSPISSLPSLGVDSSSYTGYRTLTEADINAGTFTNSASVVGTPPIGSNVSDIDDDTQTFTSDPAIGIAKRVIGSPSLVGPGTWDVTFEMLVHNFGNVTLNNIQVTDNLDTTFTGTTTFTVQSVTSTDFAVNWPGYDGSTNLNLLAGTDSLAYSEEGKLTVVVRVVPTEDGPFNNTAIAIGTPPTGQPVTDESQDGVNPDPDNDYDPTNNNVPTPVDFGPNLFDPPFGIKLLDRTLEPVLQWTMVWINDSNIVAVNAAVSDPIPVGTVFEDTLISSGYPLPPEVLPVGTVNTGVTCTNAGTITSTTYCYYEGPTIANPRGRIVWEGTLGPDLGATNADTAVNDLQIVFHVRLDPGVRSVQNIATIDSDLNGDGDPTDPNEIQVASASQSYRNASGLPKTGFAPGIKTNLPAQPAESTYAEMNGMVLEIPSLGIKSPIVGVPLNSAGEWDVTWLGNQIGWLNSTAFPTWNGNSAITAHATDANGKPGLFADLGQMSWGNKVIIHSWGQAYTFEVRSVSLWTSPTSTWAVEKHEENPWLTLITCRGYNEKLDKYNYRTVVRAVLVSVTNE